MLAILNLTVFNLIDTVRFDDDDESSIGFLTYFLVISATCIILYVAYHNRSKVRKSLDKA